MMILMIELKRKLEKNIFFKYMFAVLIFIKEKIEGFIALIRLYHNRKICHGVSRKIRCIFLCQLPQVWDALSLVFEKMLMDERFDVYVFVIPEQIDMESKGFYQKNSMADFMRKYKNDNVKIINTYLGNGKWYSLKDLSPDYVFYQRPYDNYLPKEYRSNRVSKYSRICYIPYALDFTKELLKTTCNFKFYKNIYLYFSCDKEGEIYNKKRFKISHMLGIRKSMFVGYPRFSTIAQAGRKKKNESHMRFTILWNSRWTVDEQLGKSTFFQYKNDIPEFVIGRKDMFLVWRPHPLSFSNFIDKGLMTQKEIDEYCAMYQNGENLYYDNSNTYIDTMWNSDVLISDISSLVIEYAVTGKPIILCDNHVKEEYVDIANRIVQGCYDVTCWEELRGVLENLSRGIDPKRKLREKIFGEVFGDNLEHSADNILDILCN